MKKEYIFFDLLKDYEYYEYIENGNIKILINSFKYNNYLNEKIEYLLKKHRKRDDVITFYEIISGKEEYFILCTTANVSTIKRMK